MGRVELQQDSPIAVIQHNRKAHIVIAIAPEPSELGQPVQPLMFKVKCNLKQCIEVTPVYGFLIDDPRNQKRTIEIKYIGDISQIRNLKLQICWITINTASSWLSQQFTPQNYPDIYKKCLQGSHTEKSILMTFSAPALELQSPISKGTTVEEFESPIAKAAEDLHEFRFESAIKAKQRQRLENLSKKVNEKKASLRSIKIQHRQQTKIKQDELLGDDKKPKLDSKLLVFLLVFVFLFGVTVGIKLNRLSGADEVTVS